MGKKHYQLKAAHAQAFRWKSHSTDVELCRTTMDEEDSPQPVERTSSAAPVVPDEPALGSDCEYTGGVNHNPNDPSDCWDTSMELPDSDNTESLSEFDGNELKLNLAALRLSEDRKQEPKSSGWTDIFEMKLKKDWKKAEGKRSLEYNGHSDQTHRQQEKDA